jgi:hypothetical protein
MGIATMLVARSVYPVPYEYKRIAKVACTGLLLYGLGTLFQGESVVLTAAFRVGLILTFPLVLAATGFLEPAEKQWLADRVKLIGARVVGAGEGVR